MNALTHGLTARTPRLETESAAEYAAFIAGVRDDLAPVGLLESTLAERAAVCLWRARRAPSVESALLAPVSVPPCDVLSHALAHLEGAREQLPGDVLAYNANERELDLVRRYETHAERSAYRALAELRRVQAARPMPLPS